MPEPDQNNIIAAGALFPGVHRGLTADILAGTGLGLRVNPVATALVMAGHGVVTDFVEVPEDAIRAQLEHLSATTGPVAMKIGVLAAHGAVDAVFAAAESMPGPIVLDLQLSGPDGETLLSRRGIDVALDRLGVADIVILSRVDAELVSGGEITSLDDAQVAVQRVAHRGARAVLIKCGSLPARAFDTPSAGDGDGSPFSADLLYDRSEFALFEAPLMPDAPSAGASSAHAMAILAGLLRGQALEEAVQTAKRYVTDALRAPVMLGGESALDYFGAVGVPPGQ